MHPDNTEVSTAWSGRGGCCSLHIHSLSTITL